MPAKPLLVERDLEDLVLQRTRARLLQKREIGQEPKLNVVECTEKRFYIPETGKPVVLEPFQRGVLLYSLTENEQGRLPFSLIVYSSVKKIGKSAMAGMVLRWLAEERTRSGEIFCLGNDAKQARDRSFAAITKSIRLTPGFKGRGPNEGWLPGRWRVQTNRLDCLITETKIEALAVDAPGEAGANPDATCFTELWGAESEAAVRFYHELTPPPTKPDSFRLIETYAGFDGESDLLRSIYDLGMEQGRQLTAGEMTEKTGVPLGAFEEAPNAEDLIPIWVNEEVGLFMWWDSGLVARRMTWQRGEEGEKYYRQQEEVLPPAHMLQKHSNLWVGGEGDFIPIAMWDACKDPDLPFLQPGDKTPAVLGVDAATSWDCFGVVLVTRHPVRKDDPAIRACKKWSPPKGGKIDYDEPEAFIRTLVHGGCVQGHPQYAPFRKPATECDHNTKAHGCEQCCAACRDNVLVTKYNIIEIAYDPFQLESMMGRMYREGINCQPFNQQKERAIADSMLYDMIMGLRLAHDGNPEMREHIQNCAAKVQKDEDSKLRIQKKPASGKIDLAVAASMAIRRCLYFQL